MATCCKVCKAFLLSEMTPESFHHLTLRAFPWPEYSSFNKLIYSKSAFSSDFLAANLQFANFPPNSLDSLILHPNREFIKNSFEIHLVAFTPPQFLLVYDRVRTIY